MTVKIKKLTKAEKQELIKNQADALIKNVCTELFKIDVAYLAMAEHVYSVSRYELTRYKSLTKTMLDFPHQEKILRDFLAEINMILIDLEDNKKGLMDIYKELTQIQIAIKTAFWAVNYKNEADPILSNPQSTIQQVLDVHNKHQKLYPHWKDGFNVDDSFIYLRLTDYDTPHIVIGHNSHWTEEEESN